MISVEEQVIAEIIERLREINIVDGYRSNLGLSVYADDERIDIAQAQDPTAVVSARVSTVADIMAVGDGGIRRNDLVVMVEMFAALNPLGVIADIKLAMGKPFVHAQDVLFQSWTQSPDDVAKLKAYAIEYQVQYDERVEDPYKAI